MKQPSKKTSVNNVALVYDFDGTLSPGNMQEKSFLPELKIEPADFWKETKEIAESQDMDEILAYLRLMLKKANLHDKKITTDAFREHGKNIQFFPGVTEWFEHINKIGEGMGLKIQHYIISSGLTEMIEGCAISGHFKKIYASGYFYDANNCAVWPARAVNYTTKTQYLFRINKGIENSWDNNKINSFVKEEDRPQPFRRMIYFGDGETDIPAMKMLNNQGGYSIAVYPPPKGKRPKPDELKFETRARALLTEGRAKYCVEADYTRNSKLDQLVSAILEIISQQCKAHALSLGSE